MSKYPRSKAALNEWLANYQKACAEFSSMDPYMQIKILERIRDKHELGLKNKPAIEAQIKSIKSKMTKKKGARIWHENQVKKIPHIWENAFQE